MTLLTIQLSELVEVHAAELASYGEGGDGFGDRGDGKGGGSGKGGDKGGGCEGGDGGAGGMRIISTA
jgi:hypothetical protein